MDNIVFKKILYLNGGVDFKIIDALPQCKFFVYIDSMPRNDDDLDGSFNEDKYRPYFIKRLLDTLNGKGFMLSSVDILDVNYGWKISSFKQKIKHLFRYYFKTNCDLYGICPTKFSFYNQNTDTMLIYYTSTHIVYNYLPEIEKELCMVDGIIIHESMKDMDLLKNILGKKQILHTKESSMVRLTNHDTLSLLNNLCELRNSRKTWKRVFCENFFHNKIASVK